MLIYPNINPNAVTVGSFTIKWYGICYAIAFMVSYYLMLNRANHRSNFFTKDQIIDLIFYIALGVVLGGRIGYILFYSPQDLSSPLLLIQFWLPGRSFHGGLLGVLIAIGVYSIKYRRSFLEITNFIAPIVPLGLACGRIGNFINGELYGRVTDVSWGMIFPHVDWLPRHPSQIYEFFLEGILLFLILNLNYLKYLSYLNKDNIDLNHKNYKKFINFIRKITENKSALFLIFYGLFRFFVEYYRQPDFDLNFIIDITMGQILSIPMLLAGIGLLLLQFKKSFV